MNEIKLTENRSINEKFYTLHHASGLDIYVIPKKHSTAFAVFGTRYGSADRTFKLAGEDDYLTVPDGVAHFLEHKMLENEDGTDAFALYAPFGGNANAFTSFTSTVYLFSCTEHFDENLRVLLSFVTSPHFTEETVRKEQGIIGEEIKMYIDNPSWRVYFNLLRALYVHHPVRVDIAGTVESIAQITPEILYRCYNTFYNLHNMALCICGDVTPEQVKAVADEVLKPAPEQEILRQYPDEPDEVCRPRIEESLEVSRPLFNIGIKVTPAGDAAERLRRAAATDILLDMMFGPSSEFYLKNYESGVISGKFGKSYESMADIACILFSGAADDPDKVYDAIREEIGKRRREGFTAEEFNRAKKVFYTATLSHFDSTEDVANSFLSFLFDGGNMFDYPGIVAETTLEYATECFLRDFDVDRSAISVILPIDKKN